MSTNSKYVYFTINGSKVCLFDIYTNEVLKEINIPSVIKDKELIITIFAIPAAAVMMDVSAVVYKYQLMACLMGGCLPSTICFYEFVLRGKRKGGF